MTRLDELADAVAAAIRAATAGTPTTVVVTDVPEANPADMPARQRTVFVTTAGYADAGPVSRAEDRSLYTLHVIAVEPYPEPGPRVPLPWRRQRSEWFRDTVFDPLNDPRQPVAGMVAETSGVVEFEKALLVEHKLWWEWFEITYREDA